MLSRKLFCGALCALILSGAAYGADIGPESGLPLPRFVSLKSEKANARRGPGSDYPVDWVFQRRGTPLEIVAEYGHWRKIRDVDNAGGWMHRALLRGARSAVVTAPEALLRVSPVEDAPLVARAETGVILSLTQCGPSWCEAKVKGRSGWVLKAGIWGAGPDEVFE